MTPLRLDNETFFVVKLYWELTLSNEEGKQLHIGGFFWVEKVSIYCLPLKAPKSDGQLSSFGWGIAESGVWLSMGGRSSSCWTRRPPPPPPAPPPPAGLVLAPTPILHPAMPRILIIIPPTPQIKRCLIYPSHFILWDVAASELHALHICFLFSTPSSDMQCKSFLKRKYGLYLAHKSPLKIVFHKVLSSGL